MNDYSEVTCHTQRDVVNLINALNDKKWKEAWNIVVDMRSDLKDLQDWIDEQKRKQK